MTPERIEELYRRYGYLVHKRAKAILNSWIEAEDVMQEVFIRVMKYPDGFDRADNKLYYLYKISNNLCFDSMRVSKRRQGSALTNPADLAFAEGGLDNQTESFLIYREVSKEFLSLFDRKVQAIAIHYFIDELSQEEISVLTGYSRKTVGKKLALLRKRALKFKQKHLKMIGNS